MTSISDLHRRRSHPTETVLRWVRTGGTGGMPWGVLQRHMGWTSERLKGALSDLEERGKVWGRLERRGSRGAPALVIYAIEYAPTEAPPSDG